ncbi:hypothetical protein C8Q73DRAFT_708889 [Cubamyces lactineus]|nr:hypothetical protein C8Q73DRAFT_708889 [Cubamyces lactineus]
MVTALPSNPYSSPPNSEWHNAYEACLSMEAATAWNVLVPNIDSEDLQELMFDTPPQVAGRTLGYALIHATTKKGRDVLAREIVSCVKDYRVLSGLAHLCIFGMIRMFRNPKGPTPIDSVDESPEHLVTGTSPGYTPAWLRAQLLQRDEFRCVFTHRPDARSLRQQMAAGALSPPNGTHVANTKVAHIIGLPLTDGIGGMSQSAREKFPWATSATAVLEHFGGDEIQQIIRNFTIHDPVNAMTASLEPHDLFNQSALWLTPAMDDNQHTIPNLYNVVFRDAIEARIYSYIKPQVRFREFTTPDGQLVKPPSPALLELHAACARIAHLSGTAEVLDDVYQEEHPMNGIPLSLPDMSVHAPAADYLQRALTRAALSERPE